MAVSAGYLAKIRRAVRRNANEDTDAELADLVEACRLDLMQLGVRREHVMDESDPLILGAIRCYARWQFGLSNDDAEANREDYMHFRDELRRRAEYTTPME
jgi:hypothetical protein